MIPLTHVYLFGSLREWNGTPYETPVPLNLKAPTRLSEVLGVLKIPHDRVQLSMINYRAVPVDSMVQPGDRLSLFPKEYPIFVDWKDLRF